MQDVVIVPTFDRPEMLWLCLDHLVKCPEIQDMEVRVCIDVHLNATPPFAEIESVMEMFPSLQLKATIREPHSYSGNSYNLLTAYREAFQSLAELVFLVEDDVVVRPGFFAWHRQQHKNLSLGCSIGVQNPGHSGYASLGVCFRRTTLRLLLPHCRADYFQNMRGYCKTHFQPSKFDCEQDGLIARVFKGYPMKWAEEPVAQHVGWYGYHRMRSIRPQGELADRYAYVKFALSNPTVLRSVVKDFGDIHPISCN